MANRNYIVQVYDIENGDEEIQTGVFGPMTKEEAEQWCECYIAARPKPDRTASYCCPYCGNTSMIMEDDVHKWGCGFHGRWDPQHIDGDLDKYLTTITPCRNQFDYKLYVCQLRNPWTPEITNPQPEAFRFPSSLYDL